MIKRVRCDQPSFRTVKFKENFNVVLADRTVTSSDKESRNGLGKTTLIEIIHFCLGSTLKKRSVLSSKELKNWTFILDLTLNERDITVYRNTSNPSVVRLEGEFSNWSIQPDWDRSEKYYFMRINDWRRLLGFLMFDLPVNLYEKKYAPTFRSLISYFVRKGVGAFQEPFKHYPQQKEWDIQVNNAYLLGLNWEYASEFQILKDKEKTIRELKKAAIEGLLTGYIGSLGELEAERISLQERIRSLNEELNSFKVHPQYTKIETEANELTREIHKATNQLILIKQVLNQYRETLEMEKDVPLDLVIRVYQEIGFWFPEKLRKRIEDVRTFHEKILENRRIYLDSEIKRLEKEVEKLEKNIEKLSDKRAELLRIIETHRALDEYKILHERLIGLKQQLKEVVERIENLKKFETGLSDLKIQKIELLKKARQDIEERKEIIEKAVKQFNQNSEYLYSEPGILSIDLTENGYKFKVDIKRAMSQGIGYMKVFCYDLILIQMRSKHKNKPGSLIHDSTVFDGVDERQVAKAIELAIKESKAKEFQYICTINSDMVPYGEFNEQTKEIFESSIRIKLTDNTPEGGLLGIRF